MNEPSAAPGRRPAAGRTKETLISADSIIDTLREPLLILHSDMTVKAANRSFRRTFRLSPREIENRSLYELGEGGWNVPSLRDLLGEILDRNTEFYDFELENTFPHLGRRTLRLNARQIFHDGVGTRTIFLAMEDITDRKLVEEVLSRRATDLARSNAELEQFAYVASHDLQEPLRIVASYAQLLSRRYRDRLDADADEFIAYIVDGAVRMKQLINDLLAYSRVNAQGKDFVPVDCEEVLRLALANLRMAAEESGAALTHDPLPTVRGDASQLIQLFQNLIGNAIKFRGNRSPLIHLSAEEKETEWLFSVRDNGIGIAPEYHDRIFIIFQRLHKREAYPGTGIGLAICRKIVERHGGTIRVEAAPGTGSIFYFTIGKGERKG